MKMEAAFVNWLAKKEAVDHNNCRALFEAGIPRKTRITPKAIGDLASRTRTPIEMMKNWQKMILKDRDWRPYAQAANSSKRALTNEQEQPLSEILRRDHVN
jgi:hypothetical protein